MWRHPFLTYNDKTEFYSFVFYAILCQIISENLVMFINLLVSVFCICNEDSLEISLFSMSFKSVVRLGMFLTVKK
jgi:hypothetical protein